ncbi:MAG: hypothetical protein AB3N14_15785 [Flavobacteriaceae bacterium]
MKHYIIISIFLLGILNTEGQDNGTVNFKEEGIGFTIPKDWIGQALEEAYVMGSTKKAGMIVMLFHPAKSLEELQSKLREGLYENDVQLSLVGDLKQSATNAIEGLYEGVVNSQKVKGHLFGVINPFGKGVAVLSIVAPEKYTIFTRNIAVEVVNSLRFSKPSKRDLSKEASQFKKELTNSKLVYLNTGFTPDDSLDGSGFSTGYEKRIEINLCASGNFTYYDSSNYETSSTDTMAVGRGENQGEGKWAIEDADGDVLLVLQDSEGDTYEFVLVYENEELFLNGKRYLIDYAQCP